MKRSAGFTLLELLAAIALLALLAVGLGSGIRFGTRVWDRAAAHGEALAERQTAHALLQRTLQGLVPLGLSQEPTADALTFWGDATRMRLLGPAPAQSARPGLYRVEIALADAADGRSLVFRWQPFTGEPLAAPFEAADQRVLLSGLGDAAFAYFGTRESGWVGQWTGRVELPQLVRLTTATGGPALAMEEMVFSTYLGLPEP